MYRIESKLNFLFSSPRTQKSGHQLDKKRLIIISYSYNYFISGLILRRLAFVDTAAVLWRLVVGKCLKPLSWVERYYNLSWGSPNCQDAKCPTLAQPTEISTSADLISLGGTGHLIGGPSIASHTYGGQAQIRGNHPHDKVE
jgi:hypothetical protein